jgi:hypothetical protein
MNYKVVCAIEFPNGDEEYVIWDLRFYGEMVKNNVDIYSLFYDTSRNGFADAPVGVSISIYDNPQVKQIGLKMGDNEVSKDILIGEKILPISFL